MENKLKEYIENIEQLGADLRYENDYEKYNKCIIILDSIIHWCTKCKKLIQKHIKQ